MRYFQIILKSGVPICVASVADLCEAFATGGGTIRTTTNGDNAVIVRSEIAAILEQTLPNSLRWSDPHNTPPGMAGFQRI